MLVFQHNNLKANEWVGIRRELLHALRKVDAASEGKGPIADNVKIKIIQTGIFESSLRVVEFYKPDASTTANSADEGLQHILSTEAYEAVIKKKGKHPLSPLLNGPLAVVSFPSVSPAHLAAALSILAPSSPNFKAPTRRANPGYYELAVQGGLQKLLFLGARVEGKVFDTEGTKWVGGIQGGLDGMRGQLVNMLQSISGGVTSTLEGAGRSLWFTMESRRSVLEEEANPKKEDVQVDEKTEEPAKQ
jgi:large subunit ribosomal protein L10